MYVVHTVLQDVQHMLASYSYGNIGPALKLFAVMITVLFNTKSFKAIQHVQHYHV